MEYRFNFLIFVFVSIDDNNKVSYINKNKITIFVTETETISPILQNFSDKTYYCPWFHTFAFSSGRNSIFKYELAIRQ